MTSDHVRPNPRLQSELREVSKDAQQFIEFVNGDNSLPPSFPKEHTQRIVNSLVSLHLGTTVGCREPLEYARARIARIRSDHIVLESDDNRELGGDVLPPLTRGLTLDRRLIHLLASVSTALDILSDPQQRARRTHFRNHYSP